MAQSLHGYAQQELTVLIIILVIYLLVFTHVNGMTLEVTSPVHK